MPGFLSSFADKAQNAINASPLAAHIPASLQHRPTSPDAATQPSANDAAAQGGAKSHTLEALQYQFRSLQQQYSTTSPVQKIITTGKGVAIDYDSVSRNAKTQSKELYTWGQTEAEDIKDVTDRLAYINFVQGSLANSLSVKLDSARSPLKVLRDAEANLQPRRSIRAGLQNQIARLEHDQQRGNEKRIADLREQLRKAESDDHQLESEVEILKRKAIRESEQLKWDAIREYGEKLVLLSQAAPPIIAALPSIPPTPAVPYTGAQTTGAVRASLQRALDNYKTGHINLPPQVGAVDLSRSDTRSFGESHASELSSIHSELPSHPATQTPPLSASKPLPASSTYSIYPSSGSSPPINPNALNQAPAPISLSPSPPFPVPVTAPTISSSVSGSTTTSPALPVITPTVAETGIPVSAGPDGPGPASGSLHDIRRASDAAGPRTEGLPASQAQPQAYGQPAGSYNPSAEEEKRRLASLYSQQAQMPTPYTAPQPPPDRETAEEEKKRLEREERERVLHTGGQGPNVPPKDHKDEDLPPYQEPGL